MTAKNQKTCPEAKPDYEPTKRERAVVSRFLNEQAEWAPRVKISGPEDPGVITPDHPKKTIGLLLLMEAIGTADTDFFNGILGQLANASSHGNEVDERKINFMLSVIKGIEPRDQVEAMLATQMAAVHMAIMMFASRLAGVQDLAQLESAERALNKLARTFTTQTEALKRYRTGGEEKVPVQHVTVNEGGQAIVGNVTHRQREATTENTATRPLLADAKTVPMPILQENKAQAPATRRRLTRKS
jgi:hypothetical protein